MKVTVTHPGRYVLYGEWQCSVRVQTSSCALDGDVLLLVKVMMMRWEWGLGEDQQGGAVLVDG